MRNQLWLLALLVLVFIPLATAGPGLIESEQWGWNLTQLGFSTLTSGDLDNDGDSDLILIGSDGTGPGDYSKVYMNNGTSLEESKQWQWNLTNVREGSLALGDIDNDEDLDLALIGSHLGVSYTKIYINNGTSFEESEQWQWNLTATLGDSIRLADINNDGYLDLTVATPRVMIYLNNGTSFEENVEWETNIQEAFSLGAGDGHTQSIGFADYDNDGDLDIMTAGHDGGDPRNKLFENNGTTFLIEEAWQDNIMGGLVAYDTDLAWGDVEGDGWMDVAVMGHGIDPHMLINDGTQLYENVTWSTGIGATYEGSIAWGDYDNDGDLDIAWTGVSFTSEIHENTGVNFTKDDVAGGNLTGVEYSSVLWVDIDNDADLDLIVTGREQVDDTLTKVYINNITTSDTSPTTPVDNFENSNTTAGVFFSWGNGSDTETPSTGLYYNLRIGSCSGCNDIVSGVYGGSGNPTSGYFGNMMQRRNITISSSRFTGGNAYYWSVQTIDTALNGSAWSEEQSFTFGNSEDYPAAEILLPDNASTWTASNTVTFSYNVTAETANCTLYINDAEDQSDTSVDVGLNSFTKELSNGDYYWNISCTDDANQKNATGEYSLTVSYTPSGGSGGGGSGTTIIRAGQHSETVTLATGGKAGETKTLAFNNDVGITEVGITLKNEVSKISLTVEKLSEKPTNVTTPLGKVHSYLKIDKDIKDEDVNKAKIKFKVEKSWLAANGYLPDEIVLKHYEGSSWENLATGHLSSDADYHYYAADTESFSYFAIAGENKPAPVITEVKQKQTKEEPQQKQEEVGKGETQSKTEETSKGSFKKLLLYAAIAFPFVCGIITAIILSGKDKEDKKKRWRPTSFSG